MLAESCVETPAPYERGDRTRAAMAAERGISTRQLRRRLAMERERAERAAMERARREERAAEDPDELPLVILTTDPTKVKGEWYLLDSSCPPGGDCPKIDPDHRYITSVDAGRVRIGGDGVVEYGGGGRSQRAPRQRLEGRLLTLSVNGGKPVEKTGNKNHKPDPDGLKGGVG